MIPIIGPIIGLITAGLDSYTETKKIKLKSKALIEQGKQNRILRAQDDDAEWDKIQALNSRNSWKDEYLTIVFTIPAILAFFPDMVGYVMDGFKALEQMPMWYQAVLGTIVAASFGMKKLAQFMGRVK